MTYPNLWKITLTTMALAASFALSAQAGTAHVSSARSTQQSTNPFHRLHVLPNAVTATYQYDDGTSEDSVAFGDGTQNFESLWFNQFAVIPGSNVITSVEVAWGTPVVPERGLNGTPVTIAVWSDPNSDGDPSDAVLLGSVPGTIQNADTDTFVTYTFTTPVTVPGTSFFVGDMTPAHPGVELFYQAQDVDDLAPNKSWIAAMSSGAPVDIVNIGGNDFIGTIDSLGLPGNWMIRANATSGGGGLTLVSAASRQTHGDAGKFDITLPGIDPRVGPARIVFTFSNSIASVGSASTSCGSTTSTLIRGSSVTVTLDNSACDGQTVTVTLSDVQDTDRNTLASAEAMVSFLIGDVNADGTVTQADVQRIHNNLHELVTDANFRNDVIANGRINIQDLFRARKKLGDSL